MRFPNDDAPQESRKVNGAHGYMTEEGAHRVGWAVAAIAVSAYTRPLEKLHFMYLRGARSVSWMWTAGEVRHDIDETQRLLSAALLPSALPGVRYEHRWREGDFIAWINTLVLHSATDPCKTDGPRLMHRVRLSTPKTRWRNGQYTSY